MEKEYNRLSGKYKISAREYFYVLRLALYHELGIVTESSTEAVQAEKTRAVWECACDILNAMYKNEIGEE